MLPFATEFPIRGNENRASFVSEVTSWLDGIQASSILELASERELELENGYLRTDGGEELRFCELRDASQWTALGFRHDLPDREGRIWRTEGVLRWADAGLENDMIRIRTECIARNPGALLASPKQPHLVKSLIQNGRCGIDGNLPVTDEPIWLESSLKGINLAKQVTLGEASESLPCVYISIAHQKTHLLREGEIRSLAISLGGVAHVIVEPDREFSIKLREETQGRNAYGGSIGLSLPKRGLMTTVFSRIKDCGLP